jgi:hypothetical protein
MLSRQQRLAAGAAAKAQPQHRSRSGRARGKHGSASGATQRIVGHARMRWEYAGYRDGFCAERHRATADRGEAARERERLAARGAIARQLAYWSVDALVGAGVRGSMTPRACAGRRRGSCLRRPCTESRRRVGRRVAGSQRVRMEAGQDELPQES